MTNTYDPRPQLEKLAKQDRSFNWTRLIDHCRDESEEQIQRALVATDQKVDLPRLTAEQLLQALTLPIALPASVASWAVPPLLGVSWGGHAPLILMCLAVLASLICSATLWLVTFGAGEFMGYTARPFRLRAERRQILQARQQLLANPVKVELPEPIVYRVENHTHASGDMEARIHRTLPDHLMPHVEAVYLGSSEPAAVLTQRFHQVARGVLELQRAADQWREEALEEAGLGSNGMEAYRAQLQERFDILRQKRTENRELGPVFNRHAVAVLSGGGAGREPHPAGGAAEPEPEFGTLPHIDFSSVRKSPSKPVEELLADQRARLRREINLSGEQWNRSDRMFRRGPI